MKVDSVVSPIDSRVAQSPQRDRSSAADAPLSTPSGQDTITLHRSPSDALAAMAARLQQIGERSATAASNTLKGIKSADLAPHRFELRSIPSVNLHSGKANTSVAGIFDMAAGKLATPNGLPRGAYAVRFDRPHVGPGGRQLGHHLNYGTLPKDPHTPVPAKLVKAAGLAARVVEMTERCAVPATAIIDAARLGSAFAFDGGRVGAQTTDTTGSVAGGWVGGLAGAELGSAGGAAGGAAVGGLFGGVGAVPGAAIGGVIGGLAGGIVGAAGGSWLGTHAADTIEKRR